MGDNTTIEYADATWPIVAGCDHVSEGCDICYAARLTSGRLRRLPAYQGLAERGRFNGKVRLLEDRLNWPLKWRKPRLIFVSDMADLFHALVPDDFIARAFAVMAGTPHHHYQVLTKRHARMRSLLSSPSFRPLVAYWAGQMFENGDIMQDSVMFGTWPLPNVWVGVSVENQKWADIRIPALLETPAAERWISAEPLKGPIILADHWLSDDGLDWIVAGGESGPGAVPMHPDWPRGLRDQAKTAGKSFMFKQWGAWCPPHPDFGQSVYDHVTNDDACQVVHTDGLLRGRPWGGWHLTLPDAVVMRRYSKKAAGRMLDGEIWRGLPNGLVASDA